MARRIIVNIIVISIVTVIIITVMILMKRRCLTRGEGFEHLAPFARLLYHALGDPALPRWKSLCYRAMELSEEQGQQYEDLILPKI